MREAGYFIFAVLDEAQALYLQSTDEAELILQRTVSKEILSFIDAERHILVLSGFNADQFAPLTLVSGSTMHLPDLVYRRKAPKHYKLIDDINKSKCGAVAFHPIKKRELLKTVMKTLTLTELTDDQLNQYQAEAGGVLRDIVSMIKGGVTPSKESRIPGFGTGEAAVLLIYYELMKVNEGVTDPFQLEGIPTDEVLFLLSDFQLGTPEDLELWIDKGFLEEVDGDGKWDLRTR